MFSSLPVVCCRCCCGVGVVVVVVVVDCRCLCGCGGGCVVSGIWKNYRAICWNLLVARAYSKRSIERVLRSSTVRRPSDCFVFIANVKVFNQLFPKVF
jgi:hypothetical protein